MRSIVLSLIVLSFSSSFGQTNQYQNLLDSAISRNGALFVYSKPIMKIELDEYQMWRFFYFLQDYTKKQLDTIMFAQIIRNSSLTDTTSWADDELKNQLLVNSRNEIVSKKYAIKKLKLTDEKKLKLYSKQINKYNSTDSYNRNIFYFSRPVFDNSKKYAIVQWDNDHSGLGGGGGIILYHLDDETWKEVGMIMNWNY